MFYTSFSTTWCKLYVSISTVCCCILHFRSKLWSCLLFQSPLRISWELHSMWIPVCVQHKNNNNNQWVGKIIVTTIVIIIWAWIIVLSICKTQFWLLYLRRNSWNLASLIDTLSFTQHAMITGKRYESSRLR